MEEQKETNIGWVFAAGLVAGLVALVAFGIDWDSGNESDEPSQEVMRYDAIRVCEEAVQDRLRSPSSAEFELGATGGPDTYHIEGTVDSQNGFGAMIRNQVSCEISDAGDKWSIDSVNVTSN